MQAAIPLDIVTEKTNEEKLLQSFPYIIPMIPDKEPLITARKQSTYEKDIKSQEKNIESHNTSDLFVQRKVIEEKTSITPEQERSQDGWGNKSENVTVVIEEPKLSLNASWKQISRKERLFLERTKTSKPSPQRRKRSLIEHLKPKLHKAPEKDPMIISELARLPDQDNFLQETEWTDAKEMSQEKNILRGRYGKRDAYNEYFFHYDSEYVDYDVPFPSYKRPTSQPKSVPHGAEIAVAQLYPILKSMVLGTSSLKSKYKRRPSWKNRW